MCFFTLFILFIHSLYMNNINFWNIFRKKVRSFLVILMHISQFLCFLYDYWLLSFVICDYWWLVLDCLQLLVAIYDYCCLFMIIMFYVNSYLWLLWLILMIILIIIDYYWLILRIIGNYWWLLIISDNYWWLFIIIGDYLL